MSAHHFARPVPLAIRGAELIRRLGGSWHGSRGMCLCPAHADRTPSLSVRVGTSRLLFKCFAGCDTRDVIEALRAIDRELIAKGVGRAIAASAGFEQWLERRVSELWFASRSITGTPAERYLAHRAIGMRSPALRFNAATPLGPVRHGIFRPALIAAVTDDAGLRAVQRTFLDMPTARRAHDLSSPRHMLGRPGAGAVRLFGVEAVLGLAEGVETALSAAQILDIPVWAALGSERLAHVGIPALVTRLILLPDADQAGRLGARRASAAHASPRRSVTTIWPPKGFDDWNDVLRAGGKGAVRWVRPAI